MDVDPRERLRAFGLSDSAARAYLALLELGQTEARDVSRLARIPLAKVYQTLGQLHERGLASVLPTTPRKYAPIPIEEFIEKLRERHLQEAADLERAAPELGAMFRIVGGATLADRGGITIVKGRGETMAALRAAAAKATEDLFVTPSLGWTRRPGHTRSMLESARDRGVRVRILTHPPEKDDAGPGSYGDVAEVRARRYAEPGSEGVGIYFFDHRKGILVHFVPDDGSALQGKDVGIVLEEQALVAALQCHLEARWDAAEPVAEARPRRGPA